MPIPEPDRDVPESPAPACPACHSPWITPAARVRAASHTLKLLHQCALCWMTFWVVVTLPPERCALAFD
jgi:hypothetical protein